MSVACLYLAGKVADSAKSSRDVIGAALATISSEAHESHRKYKDREWIDSAREQVNRAERALLYQLGFRFSRVTVPEVVVNMLQEEPIGSFIQLAFPDPHRRYAFYKICIDMANQSAKEPLVLQYPADAIAAGCVWMVMQLMRVDTRALRTGGPSGKPWYEAYALCPEDLQSKLCKLYKEGERSV